MLWVQSGTIAHVHVCIKAHVYYTVTVGGYCN